MACPRWQHVVIVKQLIRVQILVGDWSDAQSPETLPTFARLGGRVALEALVGVARQFFRVAGGADGARRAHLAARAVGPLHEAAEVVLGGGGVLVVTLPSVSSNRQHLRMRTTKKT